MRVIELDLSTRFSTTLFDPSPHRFDQDETPVSKRQLPLEYTCDKCGESINFKTSSFENHCNSDFSNLSSKDNNNFIQYIKTRNLEDLSFLDFYCPNCNLPTKFLFNFGPSGYWGEFFFEIKNALVLK